MPSAVEAGDARASRRSSVRVGCPAKQEQRGVVAWPAILVGDDGVQASTKDLGGRQPFVVEFADQRRELLVAEEVAGRGTGVDDAVGSEQDAVLTVQRDHGRGGVAAQPGGLRRGTSDGLGRLIRP